MLISLLTKCCNHFLFCLPSMRYLPCLASMAGSTKFLICCSSSRSVLDSTLSATTIKQSFLAQLLEVSLNHSRWGIRTDCKVSSSSEPSQYGSFGALVPATVLVNCCLRLGRHRAASIHWMCACILIEPSCRRSSPQTSMTSDSQRSLYQCRPLSMTN